MTKQKTAGAREPAGGGLRWQQHVLESLAEGVLAVDWDGLVVSMNQAAEQLTGSSFATAQGRHYTKVLERNDWLCAMITEAKHTDKGGLRAEGWISGLWGRRVPVRASASPILDAEARRAGAVVILEDLTLQRDLESDVQRAQSLSRLGEIVARLAHEIKNPLGGIRGAVQLLSVEIGTNARATEYTSLVIREIDRLTKLLEQFLQLGARGAFTPRPVNVHRVIEHVLALVEPEAKRQGVALTRLFDPSLPPVGGDEDALIQVTLNLVQNAIQAVGALPAGTARRVAVSTRIETDFHVSAAGTDPKARSRGRLLRVEVEDNGPGIPPEARANLFSPFFTTKAKGTGLGLAVSHRIVTQHGGTIRCDSRPGRTVFRVALPAWDESRSTGLHPASDT